jgi:hypothetical protein
MGKGLAFAIRMALVSCFAGAGLLLPACGGGGGQVDRGSGAYSGPDIRIDSTGPKHLLILTAPSAGWSFTFDQVRPAFGHQELFVTVVSPNPAAAHAQVVVEQRLGTTVDSGTPLTVLVRTLEHGQNPAFRPYQLAGRSGDAR